MFQYYLLHRSRNPNTTCPNHARSLNLASSRDIGETVDCEITLAHGKSYTTHVRPERGLSLYLEPNTGYTFPTTISVSIDETPSQNYIYDNTTGQVIILSAYITGDISIVGTCVPSVYTGAKLGQAVLGTMILGTE